MLTEKDTHLIYKAWEMAYKHHATQTYDSYNSLPYIFHILMVDNEMHEWLIDAPDERPESFNPIVAKCVTILHDILEDTEIKEELLEKLFGIDICIGVKALTKNEALPKDQKMMDSITRIKQTLPHTVSIIKLADRSANLSYFPNKWKSERVDRYIGETEMILSELGYASPYFSKKLRKKLNNWIDTRWDQMRKEGQTI